MLNMLLIASLFLGLILLDLGFFVDSLIITDYIINILNILTMPFEKRLPIEEALNESVYIFFSFL
jgi:hypothetical protein